MRGLLVSAPKSGSGKTTLTLGLLRAMHRRGVDLAPAKAGPDYIDPAFHEAASGRACVNLDPWAMRPDLLSALAARASSGGALLVVEGMMGLFDAAIDGSGSAADLAAHLSLPVLLAVDCRSMSHSVAALVRGFRDHRDDVALGGIVLNRVASQRHETMLRNALDPLGIPVLGAIPGDLGLELPDRHLGLVQASEHPQLETFIEAAADMVESLVDVDRIQRIARRFPEFEAAAAVPRLRPLGQRIAVARDIAFAFSYPHILDGWRRQGANISFFSPLGNEAPEPDADAIYLPGGYPELHAGQLAEAGVFAAAMKAAAGRHVPIYGECGGYMVMGEGLIDASGARSAMLGLLPLVTSFADRRRHLGYRRLEALKGGPFVGSLMAHEFHYASTVHEGKAEKLFQITDAVGKDLGTSGLRVGSACGSFMHVIDIAGDT